MTTFTQFENVVRLSITLGGSNPHLVAGYLAILNNLDLYNECIYMPKSELPHIQDVLQDLINRKVLIILSTDNEAIVALRSCPHVQESVFNGELSEMCPVSLTPDLSTFVEFNPDLQEKYKTDPRYN